MGSWPTQGLCSILYVFDIMPKLLFKKNDARNFGTFKLIDDKDIKRIYVTENYHARDVTENYHAREYHKHNKS